MSETIAKMLVETLSKIIEVKGIATFIPSAGKTPLRTYEILFEKYKHRLDWSKVVIIQMDEYLNIAYENNSFSKFIFEKLIAPLQISQFHLIADAYNSTSEQFAQYKEIIARYGEIDLILHGIGTNGHIGFNEPPVKLTHNGIVDLAQDTIIANQDQFGGMNKTPTCGVSLSLAELIKIRKSIIAASGKSKHAALKTILQLKVNQMCPASLLVENPNTEIVCDTNALWG